MISYMQAFSVKDSEYSTESGFTVLEVIVALALFGVVLSSTGAAFLKMAQYNSAMEVRSSAIGAAQQVLDSMRQLDPSTMPTSGTDAPIPIAVDKRTFNVTVTYCNNASHCADSGSRMLTVEVFYNNIVVFNVDTVYTKLR